MGRIRTLAATVAVFLAAVACGGGGGSTGGTGGTGCSKTYKVGLVTDVGKLSDKSFNATSWQGVLDAQNDKSLCVSGKYIESDKPEDYPKNLNLFGSGGYDAVVAVGFNLGSAAQAFAKS